MITDKPRRRKLFRQNRHYKAKAALLESDNARLREIVKWVITFEWVFELGGHSKEFTRRVKEASQANNFSI